ncbi:MAG: hypothetical protein AAGA56_04210 [Myxococcota bacterium]
MDYKKMMLDLFTEQIAGFYDPEAAELYIMKGLPSALQRPTLAHEVFHGIQDQHFDLNSVRGPFTGKENGDFILARTALIVGDATVLMLDFSMLDSTSNLPQGVSSIVDVPMVAGLIRSVSL